MIDLHFPIASTNKAKRTAKVANILHRWLYFCVNNPKTTNEFFSPETILRLLTLFKGG